MAFSFLVLTDFDARVTTDERNAITDSTDSILETVEGEVIEEIKSRVGPRFDMAAEFAKSGTDRSALLIRYTVDLVIYETMSRNKPRQIPEHRIVRAEDARAYFDAVGDPRGNTVPGWDKPTETDDTPTTRQSGYDVSWGSQDKLDLNY